jgi:predicted ATP-dependent endonuclease of OLD family
MYISALRITNFRRLKSVLIDLDGDISILVGANNSGKTSTAHALQLFANSERGEHFTIHDFNASCWDALIAFGEGEEGATPSRMSLDLWFAVQETDLHRVLGLLPSLDWTGTEVGLRIEYAPRDDAGLRTRFLEAKAIAAANARPATGDTPAYHPLPRKMTDYLEDNVLRAEYELRYYVLDRAQFDNKYVENDPDYRPQLLTPENGRSGKDVLGRLLRIDVLNAQRHLSDKAGGHRAEDLSRHLSRFYGRNLKKREDDHEAIRALSESEALLNKHLAEVFAPTLERLSQLGYPGLANPELVIKTALNPAALMSSNDESTKVFYVLNPDADEQLTLPDRYNGLGFKNLIYMVVELLDRHTQWMDIEEDRPPLHLVFIEEPEVHLHAQLQQVFIRKVRDILEITGDDAAVYRSQFVVTTHSAHILYERGFRPVRYFRRAAPATDQTSEVLNLSLFYDATEVGTRNFLERYLKLTHCDLFFSDAAILVEGNVERLLMPLMIEKSAPQLRSACLSILEVGGAFAYRFRTLIEFLGLTTLIVTDLDSVTAPPPAAAGEAAGTTEATDQEPAPEAEEPEETEEQDEPAHSGKACPVLTADAVTSNYTLKTWLPGHTTIASLISAAEGDLVQVPTVTSLATVRVAYQNAVPVTWNSDPVPMIGRTLEEAFALQNLQWCQHTDRQDLGLRIRRNDIKTLTQLFECIHKRIKRTDFKKTDFALALLGQDPESWAVPRYIEEGLRWLEKLIIPVEVPPPTPGDPTPGELENAAPAVSEVEA